MANGLVNELKELKPPEGLRLPARDVRAKRPLLLRGLVGADTLRKVSRVLVLAWLDITGLFLAIWTALELKAIIRTHSDLQLSYEQAQEIAPLAWLVMLLLFARSGLYADRAVRPGFARIISSLFQTTIVILVYALLEGEEFSSYYIFYGSLFFALIYVTGFRLLFERISGWILRAGGYHRRAVLVGSGAHIEAVAHALKSSNHPEIQPVGFVSLTPRPENGLKELRPLDQLDEHFDAIDEVLIADPDFPQDVAVELVDRCHRGGIRVRVAPSTMEILMDRVEFVPGQTLPLFELKPPVFEGLDYVVKRSFDLLGAVLLLIVLSPLMLAASALIKLTSRGPVIYRCPRPGIGGR